jgi:uncharacterized protein YndB with AHSA1/START domain
MVMNSEWSQFVKRIPINSSTEKIYHAWTSQAELEKWFLRRAEFFTPEGEARQADSQVAKDDTYNWKWYGYEDDVFEKNMVLEANGKDLFRFKFAGECIVTVQVKEEATERVVELSQENIPLDENPATNLVLGCGEGWTFYLANLKSYLEGGLDLRNKNVQLKRVISS